MPERRGQLRYRAVTLQASVLADDGVAAVQVKDISMGGICFSHAAHLSLGQHHRIRLMLDLGPGRCSEPLELSLRVVWSTPLGQGVQIGAAFSPLPREQQKALEGLIFLLSRDVAEDEDGQLAFRTGEEPAVKPGEGD